MAAGRRRSLLLNQTSLHMFKKYILLLFLIVSVECLRAQQVAQVPDPPTPIPACADLTSCLTNVYDLTSTSLGYRAAVAKFVYGGGYYGNTFLGYNAGSPKDSDSPVTKYSTFVGSDSGNESVGSSNIFIGMNSGYEHKGDRNVLIGVSTGLRANNSYDNVFIGYYAGRGEGFSSSDHTLGSQNTSVGSYSGQFISGDDNTTLGYSSGWNARAAERGTFIGSKSGYRTDAPDNTFVGYETGLYNSTGDKNTFLGTTAGRGNTTGGDNTFVGTEAGLTNTTGGSNTFVGEGAGERNTIGYGNVMIGRGAGDVNTSGDYNTYLGKDAGGSNIGTRNVFLGYRAGLNASNSEKKLAIGEATNKFLPVFGDLNTRQLAINAYADNQLENISLSSDYKLFVNGGLLTTANYTLSADKFKDDIDEISSALSIIESLPVRSFNLTNGSDPTVEMPTGYGYGILTDGVTDARLMREGNQGYKAIDNNGLTALLVKSVQELSAANAAQQALIVQQQEQIQGLTNKLNDIIALVEQRPVSTSNIGSETNETIKQGSLSVTPNPVKETRETTVHYSIAETVSTATLVVSTALGLPLSTTPGLTGNGSIRLSTAGFVPGIYLCTLRVGNGIIDTVRIVVE